MLRVVAPLRQLGARIDGRDHGDRAPLSVRGGDLTGADLDLAVASAQVKTALLFAGMRAEGATRITEPVATRDHTKRMLCAQGVEVTTTGTTVEIKGGTEPASLDRWVPGDLSYAMFLIVAAAITPGSDLTIARVGLNPTRTAGLEVLNTMGADLQWEVESDSGGEPFGSVTIRHSALHGTTIDEATIPAVIDELPALAVAATQAEGTTVVRGAGELRVKESDRIAVLARGLGSLGAAIEETADGFTVEGPATLRGGEVDSAGDHRMAMAFAVAGLTAPSQVTVKGWSSVETSFPEFLDVLGEAQAKKKR